MEYAVLSPDTQKTFQEIQQRIRRLQNWGSIASLKNLGLPSGNQVGASFVSLKQLASSYSPDEQLAFLLWNTQKREEQIIACLLLPKKINKEKIIYIDPYHIDKNYNDADIIFITHDHYDHYSEDDIDKVRKFNSIFVIPDDLLPKLLEKGINQENIFTLDSGDTEIIDGIL